MENQLVRTDLKLSTLIEHVPVGIVEIDRNGTIIQLNPKGEVLLKPARIAHGISDNNLFSILDHIAPEMAEKIRSSPDKAGSIITNELQSFSLSFGGEKIERHFSFTVVKMFSGCTFISFEDITQSRQQEQAIRELLSDKAVAEGKFEIASNILHDIGNAIVGFGSYISRIRRSGEEGNPGNLQKMVDFFTAQEAGMAAVFGKDKAGAVIKMLAGITETQKNNQEEILRSITDQLNIITHIQEILHIQRLYSIGHEGLEKVPVKLRSIINDCMSMLFASVEKRNICVSINVPDKLPVFNGDRTRLMQVILNILKNSIEAIDIQAPKKNISICVTTSAALMVLEIQDNGQGFDKATGSQLFKRGFTTKAHGSGIGLGSCRSIIENHGGTIDISSEGFGKGALTTIKFKI
jgi:signal transduction histidine kinase